MSNVFLIIYLNEVHASEHLRNSSYMPAKMKFGLKKQTKKKPYILSKDFLNLNEKTYTFKSNKLPLPLLPTDA